MPQSRPKNPGRQEQESPDEDEKSVPSMKHSLSEEGSVLWRGRTFLTAAAEEWQENHLRVGSKQVKMERCIFKTYTFMSAAVQL